MARFYFYKLTNDGGGAPCVQRGLLSLAICKPKIRVSAEPGDIIFGYTANSLDSRNRLVYIAKITDKVRSGIYFELKKYVGRRDCIYARRGKRFEWRKDALYHSPDDLVHDLGSPPNYPRAVVLISNDFRYFCETGTANYKDQYPEIKRAIETLGRGHRVHHDEPLRIEFQALLNQEWRVTSQKVLGSPSNGPRRNVCYRSASCGVVRKRESDSGC